MSNRSGNSYAITVIAPLRRGFFATHFWRFWLAGIVFPQVRRTVWMMQLPFLSRTMKREVIGGWWLPLIIAGAMTYVVGSAADAGPVGFAVAAASFAAVFLAGFPLRVSLGLLPLALILAWLTQLLSGVETGASAVWGAVFAVAPYALAAIVMAPLLLLVFWPSTRYQEHLYELGFLHSGQWFIVRPRDLRAADPQAAQRVHRWSLWFSANFNGPWDPYIEAFSNFIPGGLNLLYRPIDGFPLASPFYPFNRWIRFNQHTAAHYYSAYGVHTTRDVRGALTFAGALREFVGRRASWSTDAFNVTDDERMRTDFGRLLRVLHRDPAALHASDKPRPTRNQFPRVTAGGFWRRGVARRNQSGQAYSLNVLTEIAPGDRHRVEDLLASLSEGGTSPFAELRRVHNARFVILSDVRHQARPTLGRRLAFPLDGPLGLQALSNHPHEIEEDFLSGPRLFFSCTFDGENTQPGAQTESSRDDGGVGSFLDQLSTLHWCTHCQRGFTYEGACPTTFAPVDGFAVRAADLETFTELRVVERVDGCRRSTIPIQEGQCAVISRGERMPDGADRVVPLASATRVGYGRLSRPHANGHHTARQNGHRVATVRGYAVEHDVVRLDPMLFIAGDGLGPVSGLQAGQNRWRMVSADEPLPEGTDSIVTPDEVLRVRGHEFIRVNGPRADVAPDSARGHHVIRLVDEIWCGTGGGFTEDRFPRFIRDHQIHNSTFFLDSPNPLSDRTFTMNEIRRALRVQDDVVRFTDSLQRCSANIADDYVSALAWVLARMMGLDGSGRPMDQVDLLAFLDIVDGPEELAAAALRAFFRERPRGRHHPLRSMRAAGDAIPAGAAR
jgi:hypothetical protein